MTLPNTPTPQDFVSAVLPPGASLRLMVPGDTSACTALIAAAMDPDEAEYARRTFDFHFRGREIGQDDGRVFYVMELEGALVGIVGLHHYLWGPPENVWLSWFAVDPTHHGQGLGAPLLKAIVSLARQLGFSRLFVETYSTPVFSKARRFYDRHGFIPSGQVENYLPGGGSMVIYQTRL